ncbi:VWA domain-containing protein [Allorhizocola rhizosphaerae]|uniref:VWA domain-containing protein n=1 Tax=Allorhizocola rhizosphaerae TaxID=1872709 RepID=UPI000E3E247C|nr:VWA domain-containing protein [Allorhizocola rhizosphaerae]
MSLEWPWALITLLAVPLLLLLRWWFNRRRRKVAVRVSSVALIQAALPGRSLWRRRIPVVLFVSALLLLGFGTGRPQAKVPVPENATSILLAMDVSGSMCSTDVKPNRLTVAQDAAREFVKTQPAGTRIGLVAFSGISALLVAPTNDKQQLLSAIGELKTGRGTAIGRAILTSIDAIAEINSDVAPTGVELDSPGGPVPGGAYEADTIVVLTDGANTQGPTPITAAEQAAARHLRVFTIGFGTTQPSQMVCTPDQLSGDAGLRGDGRGRMGMGGGGSSRFQLLDEPTLKKVAELTGGEYFRAEDSEQLVEVLTDLPKDIVVQQKNVEITSWFVLPAVLLVLLAVGLSLWWNRALAIPAIARPD